MRKPITLMITLSLSLLACSTRLNKDNSFRGDTSFWLNEQDGTQYNPVDKRSGYLDSNRIGFAKVRKPIPTPGNPCSTFGKFLPDVLHKQPLLGGNKKM